MDWSGAASEGKRIIRSNADRQSLLEIQQRTNSTLATDKDPLQTLLVKDVLQ
jgi:hypothetical protein